MVAIRPVARYPTRHGRDDGGTPPPVGKVAPALLIGKLADRRGRDGAVIFTEALTPHRGVDRYQNPLFVGATAFRLLKAVVFFVA